MRLKLVVLLLLFSSIVSYAQDWVTVTGVVTDRKNIPMVGVIIMENGVQTGVMTNAKGKYTITTTPGSELEFKFLGYNTVKKKAEEGELNVKMKPDGGEFTKLAIGVTGGGVGTKMNLDLEGWVAYYYDGFGGAFLSINPAKWFGLKAGANYMFQGGETVLSNIPLSFRQTNLNIPVSLVITPFKLISLEVGGYQNILLDSSFFEYGSDGKYVEITPDNGALKYNVGAFAGVSINIGRTFFINARYYKGLSWYYAMDGNGSTADTITLGIGINLIKVK